MAYETKMVLFANDQAHDYSALFTPKLSIKKAIAAKMKLLGHDCTHNEDS